MASGFGKALLPLVLFLGSTGRLVLEGLVDGRMHGKGRKESTIYCHASFFGLNGASSFGPFQWGTERAGSVVYWSDDLGSAGLPG